jgi:hypothetical protein
MCQVFWGWTSKDIKDRHDAAGLQGERQMEKSG